jgi:hypothetical protein
MKTADPTKVICPACVHEFRAIPQDVQERLRTISHPTPVQGEALPVVAYIDDDEHTLPAYMVEIDAIVQKVDLSQFRHKLTYHAQATAEISRLQGEVDALKEKLTKQNIILGMTKLSVADKDRAIDQLRTQLSDATGQVGKLTQAWNAACAFIDSHAGDPDIIEEMCRTYAAFMDIRAALNSSAPK